MIGKDGQDLDFERLPKWEPIPDMGARSTALMAQNWELINMAGDILRSKDVLTEEDAEELRDIWQQTLDIEAEYEKVRAAEWLDNFTRAHGINPFDKRGAA